MTIQSSKPQSGSKHATSMADLMASFQSKFKTFKKGDIVEGTVKKLTPEEITLDIGAKSDALVLEFDKKNVENLMKLLKVGDKVRASVLSVESEEGFPVVSLRRTLDDLVYFKLEEFHKKDKPVEVKITESTKGGFFAETPDGERGFLPNSQTIDDPDLVGKTIDVKIIEFDRSKKRLIFSQKATVYLTDPAKIENKFKKDDIVEATITNVSSHGLYVSVEKEGVVVEGFVHISEVSYQRVENLPSLFEKGSRIKVQVVEADRDNRRLNLSLKRLEENTFEDVKVKYKTDQKVKGVVKSIRGKGLTLEIEKNIFGFIPEGKIPSETVYEEGDAVDALVEGYDDKHRMILLTPVLKAKPMIYR